MLPLNHQSSNFWLSWGVTGWRLGPLRLAVSFGVLVVTIPILRGVRHDQMASSRSGLEQESEKHYSKKLTGKKE